MIIAVYEVMDQVIIISVEYNTLPWQEDNLNSLVINGVTDIKNKNTVFEAKDAKSITINGSKQVNLSDTYIPVDAMLQDPKQHTHNSIFIQ